MGGEGLVEDTNSGDWNFGHAYTFERASMCMCGSKNKEFLYGCMFGSRMHMYVSM